LKIPFPVSVPQEEFDMRGFSLRPVLRLAVCLALSFCMIGTKTATAADTPPAHPPGDALAMSWTWALASDTRATPAGCECVNCVCQTAPGGKGTCGSYLCPANGGKVQAATVQAASYAVSYREEVVCQNGRCVVVRVPISTAQSSEPVYVSGTNSTFSQFHPTTVSASYNDTAGDTSGRVGGLFQRFRERRQERVMGRGSARGFSGGCSSCGG
jgi:hypothetical protein